MEQLDYYNQLFRWFVGLNTDDPVWVPTVFTHNRDRLLEGRTSILPIPRADRVAPVTAEGAAADAHAGGGLAAFVFVAVHQAYDPGHRLAIEAGGNDVLGGLIPFHVTLQPALASLVTGCLK